jgi:hypothetical protein
MLEGTTEVRIIIVLIGAVLCGIDFVSYSRQKLTEKLAFLWGMFGMGIILSGILPVLSGWTEAFGINTYLAGLFLFAIVLFLLFSMSLTISELSRKNQELAMQVSLLNNENEQILKAVGILMKAKLYKNTELEKRQHGEKKGIIRNQYSGQGRSGNGFAGAAAPDEKPGA